MVQFVVAMLRLFVDDRFKGTSNYQSYNQLSFLQPGVHMKLASWILVAAATTLGGCASTSSTSAGWAFLLTNAVDPVTATAAPGTSKTGEACVHNILGILAVGDASIEKAKKQADIKVVSTVDRDVFRILGFYGKSCTIVKGE